MVLRLLLLLFYAMTTISTHQMKDDCDGVTCYTSRTCLPPMNYPDQSQFIKITRDTHINDTCKSVFMMRPYSARKWLIGLVSLDPSVVMIKIQDVTETIRCDKLNRKSFRAYYNDRGMKVITKTDSTPDLKILKCFFLLNLKINLADAIKELSVKHFVHDEVKKIPVINEVWTWYIHNAEWDKLVDITAYENTCDPSVFDSEIKVDGTVTYERMVPQWGSMECSEPHMKPELTDSGVLIKSIVCTASGWVLQRNETGPTTNHGTATKIKARCVTQTNRMCKFLPQKRGKINNRPILFKEGANEASRLKCPNLENRKFYWKVVHTSKERRKERIPKEDLEATPECKFDGEDNGEAQYVWLIGSYKLNQTDDIRCVESLPCTEYEPLPKSICKDTNCTLNNRAGSPQCVEHDHELRCAVDNDEFRKCSIYCDEKKINWAISMRHGEDKVALNSVTNFQLKCMKRVRSHEQAQQSSSNVAVMAVGLSLVALAIIATTVIVAFFCYRQHRRELENEGILTRKKNKKKRKKGKKRSRSAPPSSSAAATPVIPEVAASSDPMGGVSPAAVVVSISVPSSSVPVSDPLTPVTPSAEGTKSTDQPMS